MNLDRPQKKALSQPEFLPMSRNEMDKLGWEELDILLVSGDAYIDHPSFASAILGRYLVDHGYRTGIVTQPKYAEDVAVMGRPRLLVGISAGALDSMLAHYTAFRKKRSDDAYTPGGLSGSRPNRATIVYTNLVRQAFSNMFIVLGGIEASLRKVSHYDFWSDKLRRSILLDAKADMIVYGMGELALAEITDALERDDKSALMKIRGTVSVGKLAEGPTGKDVITLPSHEEILNNPARLMEATLALEKQIQRADGIAIECCGDRHVIVNPPQRVMTEQELDRLYDLPFTRKAHPSYKKSIPAERMIKDSITSHRGCGGGCSFCSLALHQGRRIRSRSRKSILLEAKKLAADPDFSGSVSDVGGPSANMWQARCLSEPADCKRKSCLTPEKCKHFKVDLNNEISLLDAISDIRGIKHVRVASGMRFDLAQTQPEALAVFTSRYVGGQLKIAPENLSESVLKLMRKPSAGKFTKFVEQFAEMSKKANKEQYLIPYLMSAFPGCVDEDMRITSRYLKSKNWRPKQVQCFIPTPGTVATAMFYASIDEKGRKIKVAKSDKDRLRQHYILIEKPEEKKYKKTRKKKKR